MGQDDIIDRLMSVERQAESLVSEAQVESDRLLRDAEQEERRRHEDAIAARQHELSKKTAGRREELEAARAAEIDRYRRALKDRAIDRQALVHEIEAILGNHYRAQ